MSGAIYRLLKRFTGSQTEENNAIYVSVSLRRLDFILQVNENNYNI